MNVLIGVLITFLVVILVLYLVNMLPLDGRTKQIVRVIVIIIGVISLLRVLAVFTAVAPAEPLTRSAPARLMLHSDHQRDGQLLRRLFSILHGGSNASSPPAFRAKLCAGPGNRRKEE